MLGAALILFTGIGDNTGYPPRGSATASRVVTDELGPRDVVWVSRLTIYSFALDAGLPVRVQPTSDRSVGILPDFEDPRVVLTDFDISTERLSTSVLGAERVIIIYAEIPGAPSKADLLDQAALLEVIGFEPASREVIGGTVVSIWRRSPPVSAGVGADN